MKNKWFVNYMLVMLLMFSSIVSCNMQEYEIPITSSSEKAIQLFKEGRNLVENIKINEGRQKLNEAIAVDPDFAMAYLYKANLSGDYNTRMANLAKAVRLIDKVSTGEKYLILTYKASYDGNQGLMWENFNNLLELYPNDKRVHYLGGYLSYNRLIYDKALNYFQKAYELDMEFPPAVNMLGYTYMKLEKYDEAEQYLKKYIEKLPKNASPYDSYADLLLLREKFDESIRYYKKAVKIDESYYYPIRKIGNVYLIKKEFDEARKYFKQYYEVATQLNSKFLALYNLANSYLYENNKDRALEVYEEYKDLAIENNLAYNEILSIVYQGYIHACCGDIEKGLDYYKIAIDKTATTDLTEEQKFNLKMNLLTWTSQAYLDQNDIEKSKQELEKCSKMAEKLDNKNISDWVDMFYAYSDIKQEKYEEAINKLNKVNIRNPLVNFYYALAYELKGEKEQARKYYEKVLNEKQSGIDLALFYTKAEKKVSELK